MRRRSFLKLGFAAGAPTLFNIGCAGFGFSRARQIALGEKIRVGLVGCGAQMTGLIRRMGGPDDFEVVALCDPDPNRFAVVKLSAQRFYGSFDFSRTQEYFDYRVMFSQLGEQLDAVFVATPNHHHALPALLALRNHSHLYLEKPFALTIDEVKTIKRAADEAGVVTQVGNYGHSTTAMRMCVDAVRNGLIGDVTDVFCYSDRCNSNTSRPPACPPPKGMDWDIWCGPAPTCEYYGRHGGADGRERTGLHPHDWHSWIGYGNGSIGNMGTHIMDAPFWALDLGRTGPESVELKDVRWAAPGAWAALDTIEYGFPARGNMPPVTLHWYDGLKAGVPMEMPYVEGGNNIAQRREYLNFPPELLEFERKYALEKSPLAFMGSVFMGTKGAIWHCFHSSVRFFPRGLGRDFIKNRASYQADEHVMNFMNAIRHGGEANTNFDYSAPLAETVLLGNVAARAGKKKLLWNGSHIVNDVAANRYLRSTYRPGWELG